MSGDAIIRSPGVGINLCLSDHTWCPIRGAAGVQVQVAGKYIAINQPIQALNAPMSVEARPAEQPVSRIDLLVVFVLQVYQPGMVKLVAAQRTAGREKRVWSDDLGGGVTVPLWPGFPSLLHMAALQPFQTYAHPTRWPGSGTSSHRIRHKPAVHLRSPDEVLAGR